MILILPILISLISNWLVRWLWSTPTTTRQIRTMRLQAYASLTALSPAMTATLTSPSTPRGLAWKARTIVKAHVEEGTLHPYAGLILMAMLGRSDGD